MKPKKQKKIMKRNTSPVLDATTVGGTLAGLALGSVAGPPGAVIGGLVGGAIGILAGAALEDVEVSKGVHEAELDQDIGVIGGHIGEASPDAPKARIGAFSAGASGAGTTPGDQPSEGLMQDID